MEKSRFQFFDPIFSTPFFAWFFRVFSGGFGTPDKNRDGRAALRRPAPDGRPAVKAADLRPGDGETPVVVSEKVVRRVMTKKGLVPAQARSGRRRYSSYRGELAERPANLPLREDGTHDFHAAAPFELVVTDVTMFSLNGFRCYLSPVIDCFDGCPVAWATSRSPDDALTLGPLREACEEMGVAC